MNPSFCRLRLELANSKALQQEHGSATTWTLPQHCRTGLRLSSIRTAGRRGHPQQLSREGQQGLASTVGQKAEEAATHNAMREHMQKKAAQKLLGRYGHQLLFAAVGVILPAERHLTVGEVHEPVVGDGDAMGIAGQIMKNVLWTAERRFGVHDPVLAKERAKKKMECSFLRKRLKTAGKDQLAFPKSSLQPSRELASKYSAEHLHGKKECVTRMNPMLMIERKTTGRNHAMDMWMEPPSRTIP